MPKVDREALLALSDQWQAGPTLNEAVIDGLSGLREAGLVERRFGDIGKARWVNSANDITMSASACWWFRLTAAGLSAHATQAPDALVQNGEKNDG